MKISDIARTNAQGKVVALQKGANPTFAGYEITVKETGWPFHVHRDATPNEWNLLQQGIQDGDVVIAEWSEQSSLEQSREMKRGAINGAYEKATQLFKSRYPRTEIDGWSEQVRALEAYDANPTAANTLIDILADENGLTRMQMAESIRVARDRFVLAYAKLTGIRQRLESDLNAIDLNAPNAAQHIATIDEEEITRIAQLLKQQAGG